MVVVSGVVTDGNGKRQESQKVLLCWSAKKGHGCKSDFTTSKAGVFILTQDIQPLPARLFILVDGPGTSEFVPVNVDPPRAGTRVVTSVAEDVVVYACDAKNTPPDQMPICAKAIRDTHRVKVLGGAETMEQADRQFQTKLTTLLNGVSGWDRTAVQAAVATADEPGKGFGLPSLKSAMSFEAPGDKTEMLASAFCVPDIKRPQDASDIYSEKGDRCEGKFVPDTAGAPEVVSLTKGSFTFDPKQEALVLSWSDFQGPNVCLRAAPTVSSQSWLMNTRLSRSRRSFRWDLGAARKGGVPAGALGVVAQECGRKEDSTYVPLDVAGVSDTGNYEAQLLASNKLADVYFTVTDVQPDGSQRVVLSRRRAEFTNDLRPRIMVKVPRSATGRGKYRVNLQLYGANNRGDGNVSFAFWHD